MHLRKIILVLIAAVIASSCKKPYEPPAITAPASYLVVEGVIGTGKDSTLIKLSRTVNLPENAGSKVENNAQVNIETDGGSSYPLTNMGNGTYYSSPLGLGNDHKYRLKIVIGATTYASDYVQPKASPAIDSLTYQIQPGGLQLSVNTHDASKKTTYYRWNYRETWEFHADYFSNYIADGNNIRQRNRPAEDVYYCWQSDASSDIVVGSSARLTQDVIAQQPVAHIESGSEKVSFMYSIEVTQYAMDEQAFKFWENLQRITEQMGSIFDAQPSQLTGNIHNMQDASEPVIGYISAGSVSRKRLFVDRQNLPNSWRKALPAGCRVDSLYYNNPVSHRDDVASYFYGKAYIPIDPIVSNKPPRSPVPVGYTGSTPVCVDCTTRGTTVKPSYWPQ